MIMRHTHAKLDLKPPGGVLLRDVAGRTVTCVSGRVWLTMEHDSRDITLAARESFVVDRTGITIVAAQEASTIELSAQPARRGAAGGGVAWIL